ncbi:hypothetical protein CTRI78_v009863 [Colletotrichum trifolii]|uniref:Uncharacterized protein n=1 Tax=Colletotrichum trifolii TaxID=5466 RepID=A0A4R8QPK0_COLTR|nr:hypothetical protein CTRI78_v009863 [Colletotrichum trifolii]
MANIGSLRNPLWERPSSLPTTPQILNSKDDHGDDQIAWRVLGLHSTSKNPNMPRPGPQDFVDWCNRCLKSIWETPNGAALALGEGSHDHKRVIAANRKLLSAIATLTGMRRCPGDEEWRPSNKIVIDSWMPLFPSPNSLLYINPDAPRDLDNTNWNTRVSAPMTQQQFDPYYANFDPVLKLGEKAQTETIWEPTYKMEEDAEKRDREELFHHYASYGFKAVPELKWPHLATTAEKAVLDTTFYAASVPQNENSLWYSMAALITGNPMLYKTIKFHTAWWFDRVLTDASHPCHRQRFRMYTQLLADSHWTVRDGARSVWGNMNMYRALVCNKRDADAPQKPGCPEMLHLLADLFLCEIITFTPPDDLEAPRGARVSLAGYMEDHPFKMRVYGMRPAYGPSSAFGRHAQLLLVTDGKMEHFRPVWATAEGGTALMKGQSWARVDTTFYGDWDRHAPMPWWPGFRRNEADTGWTGDWDKGEWVGALAFDATLSAAMVPRDVIFGLLVNGRPADSPYEWQRREIDNGIAGAQGGMNMPEALKWRMFYEWDEDLDVKTLLVPSRLSRMNWIQDAALPPAVPDQPLARATYNARTGNTEPTFTSKRHREGKRRVAEIYLDQDKLGKTAGAGWLMVDATANEYRLAPHVKRRKNMK